jgi:hypothetical protein
MDIKNKLILIPFVTMLFVNCYLVLCIQVFDMVLSFSLLQISLQHLGFYIDGIKDSCLVFEQVRKIAKQYIEGSYN